MPMFAPFVTRPSPRNTPRARVRIPRNPLGILDGRGRLEIPVRSMRASLKIAERIPESESAPRGFRFLPRRGCREARLRAHARTHARTHACTRARSRNASRHAAQLSNYLACYVLASITRQNRRWEAYELTVACNCSVIPYNYRM